MISNEPEYLNYFQFIFDELWKNGVDAKVRIDNIEQNTDFGHRSDPEFVLSSRSLFEIYKKSAKRNYDNVSDGQCFSSSITWEH